LRQEGSGEDYITRSFMSLFFTRNYWDEQIKKNNMGGECSTYRESRVAFRVLVGDHLEDEKELVCKCTLHFAWNVFPIASKGLSDLQHMWNQQKHEDLSRYKQFIKNKEFLHAVRLYARLTVS
jgi:hypothetical protein